MSTKETLLLQARSFCEHEGLALSTLGRLVMNDGKFFARLDSGGDCTTAALDAFTRVFSDPAAWEAAKAAERERRLGREAA